MVINMKMIFSALLFTLVSTSCTSMPVHIQEVNIGDDLEYLRPKEELKGCHLKVYNIITRTSGYAEDETIKYDDVQTVCGQWTCKGHTNKLGCSDFNSFQIQWEPRSERLHHLIRENPRR